MSATVARLAIHPVKSLDAQEVTRADVLSSGALAHDRAYAIVDAGGHLVNAKRHALVQRLRSRLDVDCGRLVLRDSRRHDLGETAFDLRSQRSALTDWLAAFLGFDVVVEEDRETGFPDDLASPGPTLVSTATLVEIGRWFDLALDDVRGRFRANIEVGGVPPFWEDRLFGAGEDTVAFAIGSLRLEGVNPCLRCAVPTRDPWTGEGDQSFARRFVDRRRATLPAWSPSDRFDTFFRLAVNTRLAGATLGGRIRLGDPVSIASA